MLNFIDETNRVFWVIVPKNEMNKRGGMLETALSSFDCDKRIIVINNEQYRTTNGYREIAEKIKVDYTNERLIFVELKI